MEMGRWRYDIDMFYVNVMNVENTVGIFFSVKYWSWSQQNGQDDNNELRVPSLLAVPSPQAAVCCRADASQERKWREH